MTDELKNPSSGGAENGAPVIWIDTRQQDGKHSNIDTWLESHGVPYEYRKLDFGDYMRADGLSNVSVDTKQNVQEVAQNVGRDHKRFARECERAREAGYRLVILVEESRYRDRLKLAAWVPKPCKMCRTKCDRKTEPCKRYRSRPMQGATVAKIIQSMESEHGVRFEFCNRRNTARRICELLGVEVSE